MRTLLLVVVIIAVLAGGVFGYLMLTTPARGRGVTFPLTPDERVLLGYVPRDADFFAIVPTAGVTYARLAANPITRGPVEQWAASHQMPGPWMLGGADLVVWKRGGETSYAIRIDPLRAALVRIYLMIGGDSDSHTDANFRINSAASEPLGGEEIAELDRLSPALPASDLLVVQRGESRGAFPPIDRPAVSAVQVSSDAISIVSHANNMEEVAGPPSSPRFAQSALMTAWFAKPPRAADDLNRLLGTRVSPLLSDGGRVVLYEVDTHTLIPRPKGVFVLPGTDERRQAVSGLQSSLQEIRDVLGIHIQTGERDSELLVAFDDASIPRYSTDPLRDPSFPANSWSVYADPQRLVPVLEKLNGNTGLRIAAPRLFRSARDMSHWLGALREAKSLEAADSIHGGIEELRVRIMAK